MVLSFKWEEQVGLANTVKYPGLCHWCFPGNWKVDHMPLWSVDTSPLSGRSYLQSLQIGQGIIHAHGTHAWGQPLPPTPLWHVFHPFFCLMGQNTLTDTYILGHGLYLAQDGTCENQYRYRSEWCGRNLVLESPSALLHSGELTAQESLSPICKMDKAKFMLIG